MDTTRDSVRTEAAGKAAAWVWAPVWTGWVAAEAADWPAAKLDGNALDRALDHRGRTNLARLRIDLEQPPSGIDFPRFRQLHGHNAGFAPHDAATADAGVKDCVITPHNATPARDDHNTVMKLRTRNLWVRLRPAGGGAARKALGGSRGLG